MKVIDHYKYRYGEQHTYWVHQMMTKVFRNVNNYKFNYLFKAFLAY